MTPPLAARPFARRSACALVIVLSAFVAGEARAQERWHTQAIEPLPPGAVVDDLAFHEREGYLAVRAGDASGHVVRLRFPDDGPPTFADAGFSGFSYLFPFVVSFHGTHVAVTTEVDAIGLLDVASGVWDLTLYAPPSTSGAVQLLEVDATGGARLLVTPQPLAGTGADLQYFDGASWLEHELGSSDDVRVALLSGDWAAGVSDDGHVYVSYDVAAPGSWQDLGALLPDLPAFPEEGSAARLDDGSVAAVLARDNGSWAVRLDGLDESAATVADCSAEVISAAPSGFRRVAASEGALHALDREGRVHRIVDPASCAGWGGGVVSPALFTDPVGLGAVSDDLALAVGHRAGDGVPLVAWRNRPPRLAPLDPVDLDEGSVTTVTVDATDPDPADADTIVVSASCDASAVEIDVSGLELTVRAGAFAQACAASSERVSCAVTASDGERSASEGFAVNVRDVDGVVQPSPPSLTREGIAERTVPIEAAGVSVPLAVTVTDDCADENTVVWDLSALPEALLPSGSALVRDTSAEASRSLVLSAPLADALALDGVEAEVVATVEDGVAGADEVRFLLRFVIGERLADGATVELSLSAPSTRALGLGDVVRVDAALSSTLALPSLRVTLANGELAALDGSVEMAGSSCGASGSARARDDGLVIEAEGVDEGCPLSFHFLARKGLAREALRVTSCTWGPDDAVIARCAGGLSVTRERALGCAQLEGSGAGLSFGLLALVTLLARRRRGAERGVSRPRGSS